MKRKIGFSLFILSLCLLSIVSYHRFQAATFRVFYSLFPILSWVSVDQPILFNHIHHKEVAKLECSFCHRYAQSHRVAGIPNIELCKICHATDAVSKRPEALKVVKYVQEGKPIPWRRMYELPPFVVFPHSPHLREKVDCSVCHGMTGEKERPLKMVDRNTMAWCVDCHKKRKADTDCYTCHSN